jgi:hypothetical protein
MTKPQLTTIRNHQVAPQEPPKPLMGQGAALWSRLVAAYDFSDPAGAETLWLACDAESRRAQLSDAIAADGKCRGDWIKLELALRAFIAKSFEKLGLEPIRSPGRPPSGGLGVTSWDK